MRKPYCCALGMPSWIVRPRFADDSYGRCNARLQTEGDDDSHGLREADRATEAATQASQSCNPVWSPKAKSLLVKPRTTMICTVCAKLIGPRRRPRKLPTVMQSCLVAQSQLTVGETEDDDDSHGLCGADRAAEAATQASHSHAILFGRPKPTHYL